MAPVVMDRWLLLILISLALRTPEILNFVYPPLSFYQSNRVQKNSTENVISFRQATRLILLFQVIRFAVPCFFSYEPRKDISLATIKVDELFF